MKSVKRKFLIFLVIFCMPYQGHTSCNDSISGITTALEDTFNTLKNGVKNFFTLNWRDLWFDGKLLKFITARAVKDNSFFNSRIEVCDYKGDRCTELPVDTLCHPVYGMQETGGGVSARVFIDWKRTKKGEKIVDEGDNDSKDGLEWEWAEGVTEDEQNKFADSPKICACSQKDACVAALFSGRTQFCDTCEWSGVRQTIKCVPLPRAPSPPPFCEHLPYSASQQVDIIPVKNMDNDYVLPRVRVKIGRTIQELYVLKSRVQPLNFEDKTYYFKTDRRDGKICATYCGTKAKDCNPVSKFPERCFPAPHVPQPEIEEVVDNNTLKIKIKMSKVACEWTRGKYNNVGYCIFDINNYQDRSIGENLLLHVVKPKMKGRGDRDIVLKQLLDKSKQFFFLQKNECIPAVKYDEDTKAIQYEEASSSDTAKMLCISGWTPDPEESILIGQNGKSFTQLRLEGIKYVKCPAVYSLQSYRMFYGTCYDAELPQDQEKLDKVAFDVAGNIFFTDEREEESCSADTDTEAEKKAKNGSANTKCMVYKLENSQTYIKKNNGVEDERYIGMFDEKGKLDMKKYVGLFNDKSDQIVTVNKSEVFYADKLCTFDLNNLKSGIQTIVMKKIDDEKSKRSKEEIEKSLATTGNSGNLSKYESVDIEVWGNGEDGKLVESRLEKDDSLVETRLGKNGKFVESQLRNANNAKSKKEGNRALGKPSGSRLGKPGDYIKVKLGIDKRYPFIRHSQDQEGSTIIEMCNNRICKKLIKVAGGQRSGNARTMMYRDGYDLKIGQETIVQVDTVSSFNSARRNEIMYIKDGKVAHRLIGNCGDPVQYEHGAGGCIDYINNKSGKGSKGLVKITPIYAKTTEREAKDVIDQIIDNIIGSSGDNQNIDGSVIEGLDIGTIKQIINEGIAQELSCSR